MPPYVEEFSKQDDVMLVRLSGTFPNDRLADTENLFAPLVAACRKDHCCMAIVDARDLHVDFDTLALFRAGVDAATTTRDELCVALVARDELLSPFFDDVIQNRGAHLHVFTDMDSARAWIGKRRASRPTHA